MAEYIERARVKELLRSHYFPTDQPYESDRNWAVGFNAGLDKAIHKIHYAPAADVVPAVHAQWEIKTDDYDCEYAKCSACGEEFYDANEDTIDITFNYCPNCGARMKGGGSDEG